MHNSSEVANFFWHGPEMSCYERACISSFIKHGFFVNVWSYAPLCLPTGATPRNAADVLPITDLTRYTQAGKAANIAAFTDFFRYELLCRFSGWWFDTDVLCLQSADNFSRFEEPLVISFQSHDIVNGAVLKANEIKTAQVLKAMANEIATSTNNNFIWGAVGPNLITEFLKSNIVPISPEPSELFYPVHYSEAELALDPALLAESRNRTKNAFTFHIWNEIIRWFAFPKSLMPPVGSFLYEQFIDNDPSLSSLPTLPVDTYRNLVSFRKPTPIGFMDHIRSLGPSLRRAIVNRIV